MNGHLRSLAAVTTAAVVLGSTALAASVAADSKSPGGSDPVVTLRLATGEHDNGAMNFPELRHFAEKVGEVSGGSLKVTIVWDAVHDVTDYEQAVIDLVRADTVEMGWVGTRAFDVLGVNSFQALQAPFLITDHEVLGKVVTSSMPDEMLEGLAALDLVGLGLVPQQLRLPASYGSPFQTLDDLAGKSIRVPTSNASDAVWRALGAEPRHLNGQELAGAQARGELDGVDLSIGGAFGWGMAAVTGNLVLYPRVDAVLLSSAAAAQLSETQLGFLREAVQDTIKSALGTVPDSEIDDASRFCATGSTIATADQANLDRMIAAVEPVVTSMRQDPLTSSLIDRISALKAESTDTPDVLSCAGIEPPVITGFPDGTYTTILTRQRALEHDVRDDVCSLQRDGLHLTWEIGRGRWHLFGSCEGLPTESWDLGRYTVEGDTITYSPNAVEGSTVFRWVSDGPNLSLQVIDESNSPGPIDVKMNHYLYEHDQWVRQAD